MFPPFLAMLLDVDHFPGLGYVDSSYRPSCHSLMKEFSVGGSGDMYIRDGPENRSVEIFSYQIPEIEVP